MFVCRLKIIQDAEKSYIYMYIYIHTMFQFPTEYSAQKLNFSEEGGKNIFPAVLIS